MPDDVPSEASKHVALVIKTRKSIDFDGNTFSNIEMFPSIGREISRLKW